MRRTREQILEALVRTIGQGVAGLSIPAVAREADVSIPTVYRYFHTKQELVSALGGYLMQKIGLSDLQPPRSLDELLEITRQSFIKSEGLDDAIKAATVSELGNQFRKGAMPVRIKFLEQAIAAELAPLNERDRVRLRNMVLILTSSAMIRAFQEYLDLSGEEAANNVIWAVRLLVRAATQQAEAASDG
ncbi:MAG TPA: TetR/AcrR family transcriptional regulator [Ktedonobacteraceae bacterium]|nr:TetR/AcrR family transcriptional regulator [Ktedonobacteraceae bacterium]